MWALLSRLTVGLAITWRDNCRLSTILRLRQTQQFQRGLGAQLFEPAAQRLLRWRGLLDQAQDRGLDLLVVRWLLGLGHRNQVKPLRAIVSPHRSAALADFQVQMPRPCMLLPR